MFKRIASPLQSKRLAKLFNNIKSCFKNEEDKILATINALDLLIAFKNDYPDDYEEIFKILDEILENYENNPKVKSNLIEIFK